MQMVKRIFYKISNNFILYYFVLLVFFVPNALTLPSLSFRTAIVTAVGVDSKDDQIEVSILTLSQVGQGDNKEQNKMVSATGKRVSDAIGLIELRLGRKVQMGHVKFVLLSEQLAQNDISNLIDCFIRTSKISNSVTLVICKDNAKQLLSAANKLTENSSYNLSEIISNDYNDTFTKETSIDYFFKGYFSPNKISSLGYISMTNDESGGIPVESQVPSEQGGADDTNPKQKSEETNSEQDKNIISFNRENVIFKNGKMLRVLDKKDMDGLNWISTESTHQYITLENYTEKQQNLENATITMEVVEKFVRDEVNFEKGIPTITFYIVLELNMLEIIQQNDNISNSDIKMTPKLLQAISDKAKQQFCYSVNKLKNDNTDVVNAYQLLNSKEHKKFQKMLKSLNNPEEYLKYVQFRMDIVAGLT